MTEVPRKTPWLRHLALAGIAAALAAGAEALHLWAGVWALPEGASFPLWLPLVYLLALPGAALAFHALEGQLGPGDPPSRRRVVLEALGCLLLFLTPPLLCTHELLLAGLCLGWLALRLLLLRRRGDLAFALLAVVADLAIEGALARAGLFRYRHAAWAPLPLWLAPFWGGMALGLRWLALLLSAPHASPGASRPRPAGR